MKITMMKEEKRINQKKEGEREKKMNKVVKLKCSMRLNDKCIKLLRHYTVFFAKLNENVQAALKGSKEDDLFFRPTCKYQVT